MPNVHVHVADPIGGEQQRQQASAIVFDTPLPTTSNLQATYDLFAADAKTIADALWASLPGGTISQLCAEMLSRKASLYRVRMPEIRE